MPVVSGGGTPAIFSVDKFPMLTEHRAGTYIFNDVMTVASGTATWDNCAMRVRATVVSRPTDDRAVFDCGTKVLTSDLYTVTGYGHVLEYPDAVIPHLSEEHGVIDLSSCAKKPEIGEVIHVVPEPLLRGQQHGGRDVRRARRQGRGHLAGGRARHGSVMRCGLASIDGFVEVQRSNPRTRVARAPAACISSARSAPPRTSCTPILM